MAKVGFVSLGCPKNLIDSEVMLGHLSRAGHEITPDQEQAEIIVVNTCAFIESAKQESIDTILEMAQQKWKGKCRRLVVAGCLVERYRTEIQSQIPEVDAVVGTSEIPRILEACSNGSALPVVSTPSPALPVFLYTHTDPRILTTPQYTAYVKIAEGCDHPCTFCAIPKMRGLFRSRRLESVVSEARDLAARGVREINLVGQDTTMYGWDWGCKTGLAELIRELGKVESLKWVRFLYAYPNNIYPDLLKAIAETENACKYIDLPLQHASGPVLKRMKEKVMHSLLKLLERIRKAVPGAAIRTTMIVGFPGETETDFGELCNFVKAAEFDRLGVFDYSDEEQTPAYDLPEKVAQTVKQQRKKRLMQMQRRISRRRNRALVGQTRPVLIEGPSRESDLVWAGRLSTQAPEIDGVVYLNDGIGETVRPGDIREVLITEAFDYDLVGSVVG